MLYRDAVQCSTSTETLAQPLARMACILAFCGESLKHSFQTWCLQAPNQRLPMMHQLALDLVARLQEGDEFLAHDLMSTVLFNADFIP